MRILLDCFWWDKGPVSNQTVLHELVSAWARTFPDDELILAVPKSTGRAGSGESAEFGEIVQTVGRLHPLINGCELPRIARRVKAEAVLAQNFTIPYRCNAVFVYDVLFQSNPEWFSWIERVYFGIIPLMARKAKLVVTLSNSECERIKRYNPRLRRVVTFGLSVPSSLLAVTPVKPACDLTSGSFFLTVGRINVRKNLNSLVLGTLASGLLSSDCPLVLVSPDSEEELQPLLRRYGVEKESVQFVPGASVAELRWLYENCRVFIFLSFDEGYGLPPAEASALGAKVMVSDRPVFREVLGEAASYVDPTDVSAIGRILNQVVISGTGTRFSKLSLGGCMQRWNDIVTGMRTEMTSLGGN